MSFEIGHASFSDVEWVSRLEEKLFGLKGWKRADFQEAEREGNGALFLVGRQGTQGIAYILGQGSSGFIHLGTFGVDPLFQKKGVGRKLLRAFLEEAKKESVSLLTLEVRASNQGAIHLYESEGWKCVGRRPTYYKGPIEDGLIFNINL